MGTALKVEHMKDKEHLISSFTNTEEGYFVFSGVSSSLHPHYQDAPGSYRVFALAAVLELWLLGLAGLSQFS